jgi:hypothetical protein
MDIFLRGTYNVNVGSCTRYSEEFAIMREAQIIDTVSTRGQCPLGYANGWTSYSQAVIVLATIQSLISNKLTIESRPPEAKYLHGNIETVSVYVASLLNSPSSRVQSQSHASTNVSGGGVSHFQAGVIKYSQCMFRVEGND